MNYLTLSLIWSTQIYTLNITHLNIRTQELFVFKNAWLIKVATYLNKKRKVYALTFGGKFEEETEGEEGVTHSVSQRVREGNGSTVTLRFIWKLCNFCDREFRSSHDQNIKHQFVVARMFSYRL